MILGTPVLVSNPQVLLAAALAVFCVAAPLPAVGESASNQTLKGWKTEESGGQTYVSALSIRSYYRFSGMARSKKTITLHNKKVVMKITIDSHECLMNGMKFTLSFPVREINGQAFISQVDLVKLIDPVLRPNFIRNAAAFKTVIIDPGHGGKDPGATNSLGTEAGYNLELAEVTRDLLRKKGFHVIMTREDDRYLSLQERVRFANSVKQNAIFLSIHFNAGRKQARGIETFTLSPPGVSHYGRGTIASDFQKRTGNQHDSCNIALATAVHGQLVSKLKTYTLDRGIKRARFNVLSGVRHPAILLEGGFMSHPYEAKLIHDKKYRKALANGIVDAILKYRFAVGRKRPSRP